VPPPTTLQPSPRPRDQLAEPWVYEREHPAKRARQARRFAIVARNQATGIYSVRLLDEASGSARVAMASAGFLQVLDWTADGTTLFVGQTDATEMTTVYAVDAVSLLQGRSGLSHRSIRATPFRGPQMGSFTVHPDGSRVAYSRGFSHEEI
jgi:hypothetical protein